MANNRLFLPGQEFPLWTGWAALIDGSGEVKLSCNVNEDENTNCSICLVSMEMNASMTVYTIKRVHG